MLGVAGYHLWTGRYRGPVRQSSGLVTCLSKIRDYCSLTSGLKRRLWLIWAGRYNHRHRLVVLEGRYSLTLGLESGSCTAEPAIVVGILAEIVRGLAPDPILSL